MSYVKTDNIICFPTGRRGGTNRQLSETNLTRLATKLLLDTPTCIIDYKEEKDDCIEFFIRGYYFEIKNFKSELNDLFSEKGIINNSGKSKDIVAMIILDPVEDGVWELYGQDNDSEFEALTLGLEGDEKTIVYSEEQKLCYLKLGSFSIEDSGSGIFSVCKENTVIEKLLNDKFPKTISGGKLSTE